MGTRAEGADVGPRGRRALVPIIMTILAGLALVYGISRRGARVETAVVQRGELVRTVVTSGRVAAPIRTALAPEVSGRVVAVAVEEGQRVARGELLVQLDDDGARDAVAEAAAALAEAEARLARERRTGLRVKLAAEARALAESEQAGTHLERTRQLVEAGALGTERLEEAQRTEQTAAAELRRARAETEAASAGGSEVRLLVASVRRSQAALQSAERRLAETAVRAPSDGIILERSVEAGKVVSAGQAVLEFVADGDPKLEVHPDESHLAFMRRGQSAVASVEARPEATFAAKVERIAPAVDAARGTVKVELSIEPPVPEFLMTGMTASVEIELARRLDVIIAPAEAFRDTSGAAPWVLVAEDGRAERRGVKLGMRAGDRFEVLEGLREGERVIVSPPRIEPGVRVRVAEGS